MKLKRKIISAILAVAFVFAYTSTVFAQEYVLIYNDIEERIKLPYTFADVVPEACGDYFEELLKNPVSSEYKGAYAYDYFVFGNTFGATAVLFGQCYEYYKPSGASYMEQNHVRSMYLIVAISEKDNGNILGLELAGTPQDINSTEFKDKTFELPDYFDYEKHQVILFNYVVDFYVEGSLFLAKEPKAYVYDPVYVDVGNYIYGDANENGVVDLADVTLMMKYMARWNTVKVDTSLLDTEHSKTAVYNCWYTLIDVSYVLKMIAGWDMNLLLEARLKEGRTSHLSSRCATHYIVTD